MHVQSTAIVCIALPLVKYVIRSILLAIHAVRSGSPFPHVGATLIVTDIETKHVLSILTMRAKKKKNEERIPKPPFHQLSPSYSILYKYTKTTKADRSHVNVRPNHNPTRSIIIIIIKMLAHELAANNPEPHQSNDPFSSLSSANVRPGFVTISVIPLNPKKNICQQ